MRVRTVYLLAIVGLLVFSLSGCNCMQQAVKGEAAPPPPPEVAAPASAPAPEQPAPAPEQPAPPPPPPAVAVPGLAPVYFDFDRYNIRSGDDETLKMNLTWFQQNRGKKVRIEGNCDERGTVEYNMVLGQKRADAAKDRLKVLGVDGGMLETISYGKDRPLCSVHNEGCWSKNRRDDFKPMQ